MGNRNTKRDKNHLELEGGKSHDLHLCKWPWLQEIFCTSDLKEDPAFSTTLQALLNLTALKLYSELLRIKISPYFILYFDKHFGQKYALKVVFP